MTWNVNNTWIMYSIHIGYKTKSGDIASVFNRCMRYSQPLAGVYLEELKSRFPKAYDLIKEPKVQNFQAGLVRMTSYPDPETMEQSNSRLLKALRIFTWNKELREHAWEAYKNAVLSIKAKDKDLRLLAMNCNKKMREESDAFRYLTSKYDITRIQIL